MAKKKVNVRKDYSYEAKKGPVQYKRASVPRKSQFLILRGPGLDPRLIIEENARLRVFEDKEKIKLKFLLAKTEEEIVKILKESNSWANGAVVNLGELLDESGAIKRTLGKVLYKAVKVSDSNLYESAILKITKPKQAPPKP